jgi:CheY-like chemotaxis protein
MPRVLLIHWNAAEADERADRLRREGFDMETFSGPGGEAFRALADSSPDAILIDLARLPSQGRAVGVAFRQRKATRAAPLVFIEGEIEKTAPARALLPDAVFTTWPKAGAALRRAMRERIAKPAVPDTFAGYAGTPLARKLRIREGSVVALLRAPGGFEAKLEPLPEGVRFVKKARDADVILAFLASAAALRRAFAALTAEMREGRTLWIVWPKRTSALAGDLSQPQVREMGLAAGLVDYKICAVDETWSGLAFAVRSAKRG